MRKVLALLGVLILILSGCGNTAKTTDIAATTAPVYEFTQRLCQGTNLTVTQLVTESVSCLHDYSLNVGQVKAVEGAKLIVISGAGLEDFMEELLTQKQVIDASSGIELLESCHEHDHGHGHDHDHESDAHIWLSPDNALSMAENICNGLAGAYPEYRETFERNLTSLLEDIQTLKDYEETAIAELNCRKIVTFHDGFSYFADYYGLEILAAVEEESGAEASASELKEIIGIVTEHDLPAIFVEKNGSASAAAIISAETGASIFNLDMAMSDSWFEAMYHNIDTIKEALG